MFSELDDFLDSFLDRGTPGYDLAVFHKGECVYRRFRGYSDYENKIPMNGKERYNLYSCSKVMTATAAMMLWERGLFRLEDKLSDYMPEFSEMKVRDGDGVRAATRPILIEHLFTMTAGFDYEHDAPELVDFRRETGGVCKTRDFARYIARRPLLFEPGEMWHYSFCHDVLAAFVEVISGERFGEFVRKNIFLPCGMTDSTFYPAEWDHETVAAQYRFNENGVRERISKDIIFYNFGSEYESGGAGCVSSVDDCMKFIEALRKGELLKPETLKLMTTDRIEHRRGDNWITDYGYGLGVKCARPGKSTGIFGWGGAAGADMTIDAKNGITLYFAQHVLRSPVAAMKTRIIFLVQKLLGYEPDGVICHVASKRGEENARKFGQ